MSTSGDGSNIATAKRKRGCTPGLKNRPKFPIASSTPDAGTLQTHVLNIPAGGDVAETVAAFARGCRIYGVCVLSASGPIAAAVLWKASPYPSTQTFQGSFHLLSMTATFLPGGRDGSLAVTLAGLQGQVVGGVAAGPVVAAGTVIVVAATYTFPAYHCFPALHSTSASLFPSIGGEEGGRNNLRMEKCNERAIEHVDSASILGESGRAETFNGNVPEIYVDAIEQHLDLPTEVEGAFSGATVDGEGSGEEEIEEDLLKRYAKDLEQYLALPAATGDVGEMEMQEGSDCGIIYEQYFDASAVADDLLEHFAKEPQQCFESPAVTDAEEFEMQEFADSCLIGGSDGEITHEQHSDAPTVMDGGFRNGPNSCSERSASDPFRILGACLPLY